MQLEHSQIRKNNQKKKIFHCFTFSEHPSGKALSLCCSVPHVETDEIPVSCVTLLSAVPKVSLNCKNTKPLWICHLPSLYLELQAGLLLRKQRDGSKLRSARFSFLLPFSEKEKKKKKTKRVVSMLSGNYTAQDISPSYLALKDTSVVVTIWVSPLAQLAILKPGNKLDKRQDQCFMGWLLHGNYDFEKLGPSPFQTKVAEEDRGVMESGY